MSDSTVHLTYACVNQLTKVANKAALVWNDVLKDLVVLHPWKFSPGVAETNIRIMFSDRVQTDVNPTRVAQCSRTGVDQWLIELDGSGKTKWAISGWSRFWGNGEDAYMAVLHELGHVFAIPHNSDPDCIMHPEIGGSGTLPASERRGYRAYFIANNE